MISRAKKLLLTLAEIKITENILKWEKKWGLNHQDTVNENDILLMR